MDVPPPSERASTALSEGSRPYSVGLSYSSLIVDGPTVRPPPSMKGCVLDSRA